jgi:hypothetical protein
MRSVYNPREIKLGNDLVTEFTFGFKIVNKVHLLVLQVDITDEDEGVLTVDWSVYANDTTYFTTVLNADESGGKITFGVAPATGKRLILLLADDLPKQESKYTADGRYTMKKVEESLDALSGQIQRLRYLCDRSFQLPEKFTKGGAVQDDFDVKLVDLIANGIIVTDEDNGFVTTKTIETILTDAGIMQIITQASLDAANALAASQTATGNVAALATRVTTAENDITALGNRITQTESDIDILETDITELESDNIAQQADIEDLQAIVQDHEERIVSLEEAGASGSGGGGSPQWFSLVGGAAKEIHPTLFIQDYRFSPSNPGDPSQNQGLRMCIKRSEDQAATPIQKFLRFSFISEGGSDFVGWTLTARLIKFGMALNDTTYEEVTVTEIEMSVVNGYVSLEMAFSDGAGLIGGADFEPGDMVILDLVRTTPSGTEDSSDSCLIDGLTAVKAS